MNSKKILKLILLLALNYSKVVVIDDLGVTNRYPLNKKPLIDKVREKIKSGEEEVVIYGKNRSNRNIKISSKDIDEKEKFKKELEARRQALNANNEMLIRSLKRLVGAKKSPILPTLRNNNQPRQKLNEKIRVFNMKKLNKEIDEIDIDEQFIERPQSSTSNDNLAVNAPVDINSDKNDFIQDGPKDFEDTRATRPPDAQTSNDSSFLQSPFQDTPSVNTNPYSSYLSSSPLYISPFDSPSTDFEPLNSFLRDNISLLKSQEKANLSRAIQNRKEYLRIKIDEVHKTKDKIARQLAEYKQRVEDLANKIKTIGSTRDNMLIRMSMQRNHIDNLQQNSEEIKEKENNLRGLIKQTKNEILKYKRLLENEKSKMEVLEKQYEVYENTLKRYSNECNQEGLNLSKDSNALDRHENDLNNLKNVFSIHSKQLNNLRDNLKKASKLESDLNIEASKLDRADLGSFV